MYTYLYISSLKLSLYKKIDKTSNKITRISLKSVPEFELNISANDLSI